MPGLVHVVDDDAAFRTAIERRLKHAGYEVATYASAQHLLDRLPNDSVLGCILLDVRIPGPERTRTPRSPERAWIDLPIIFLTGHPDIPITVQSIKAGAEDFLTKPVSSDQLLQAIERAIARHEATRRPEGQAGHRSLSYRDIDASREGSLRAHRSRPDQQAGRQIVGLHRAHDQGSSPTGDGKNAGPVPGGTCLPCRAGRRLGRHIRQPNLTTTLSRFRVVVVLWDNRKFVARGVGSARRSIEPSDLCRSIGSTCFSP